MRHKHSIISESTSHPPKKSKIQFQDPLKDIIDSSSEEGDKVGDLSFGVERMDIDDIPEDKMNAEVSFGMT